MNLYRIAYFLSDESLEAVQTLERQGALWPVSPCEHGNVYRHIIRQSISHAPLSGNTSWEWCEGQHEQG